MIQCKYLGASCVNFIIIKYIVVVSVTKIKLEVIAMLEHFNIFQVDIFFIAYFSISQNKFITVEFNLNLPYFYAVPKFIILKP